MTTGSDRRRSGDADYARLMQEKWGDLDRRPKLVIRPDLSVLWHSANAKRLLAEPSPAVLHDERLWFPSANRPNAAAEFLETVGASPAYHLLRGASRGHWAVLCACRLEVQPSAVAIVVTLSTPIRGVHESGLAAELNLTRSETNVLDLFAGLKSPKDIAEDLGISVDTVRSHLKQIYSKADVETSVQLLRLTSGFCS